MNRPVWVCARAGFGTPNRVGATLLLVLFSGTPAVLLATGTGGLVVPRGVEIAAGLFAFQGLLLSWLLFGSLLDLAGEMQRLRLPDHRAFLAGTAAIILGLTWAAPAALLFVVHRSALEVLAVAVACGAGIAAAFLRERRRRRGSRSGTVASPEGDRALAFEGGESGGSGRSGRSGWSGEFGQSGKSGETGQSGKSGESGGRGASGASAASTRTARRLALRAMHMALGPPYAPAPWVHRLSQIAMLGVVLVGIPALALVLGAPLRRAARTEVFHAGELLGLAVAAGLCWAWPLSRVQVLLNRGRGRGALAELAVLPGLGDGRQQRRRLYRAILAGPGVGLGLLLLLSLGVAWLQREPLSVYVRLAVEFVGLPLCTLPIVLGIVLGQISRRRVETAWRGWAAVSFFSQAWAYAYVVWVFGALPLRALPVQLLWTMILFWSALLILLLGTCFYQLRKFARRPHPFVELAG